MGCFNLSSVNKGLNDLDGSAGTLVVQCDNMYCETTITRNADCLENWIAHLPWNASPSHHGKRLRIAMDMIWDNFIEDGNLYRPSTIQFCHQKTCIIYHVSPPDNFPRSALENFLNSDDVDFFSFQMLFKVQYLRQEYNLVVKNWFDIPCQACFTYPARFLNNLNSSLQTMVLLVFLKWYAKPANLLRRDWRSFPLSEEQVMYATLDCFFAYMLADRVSNVPRLQ